VRVREAVSRHAWIVIVPGGGGVAPDGLIAFCIDQVFPERCIICSATTGSPPPVPSLALSARWPEGSFGFFGTDFSMRLFPGIRVSARVLCGDCWQRLEPAVAPAFFAREDRSTGRRPEHDGGLIPIVCPFLTNGPLLEIIRYLKFSGGVRAAQPLSWWMAFALRAYLPSVCAGTGGGTVVTAVPLHPARMRRRGYNQAALLGELTAKRLGLEFSGRLIIRTRNTAFQSHTPEEKRAMNVRDAFRLHRRASVGGMRIVLVDDLVTTGETAASCLRALLEGGPDSVVVLAAGRAGDLRAGMVLDRSAPAPAP
jgi:ComF family protein